MIDKTPDTESHAFESDGHTFWFCQTNTKLDAFGRPKKQRIEIRANDADGVMLAVAEAERSESQENYGMLGYHVHTLFDDQRFDCASLAAVSNRVALFFARKVAQLKREKLVQSAHRYLAELS